MSSTSPLWRPDFPYNDLPQLPPAHDLESKAALKRCIVARAALAELKQAAELIPNQSMLINTIPLLEAKDSSEIENIVTTTDKLFRHAQGDSQADPATKEALRYRSALRRGFLSLRDKPLCTATAVDICATLKGVAMDIRRTPGAQLINDRSGDIIYTPPDGEARLRDLLANWERFLHNSADLDPLIRMAVGHYQFEAIHPFTDGNGRTARALATLILAQRGFDTKRFFALDEYYNQDRTSYYEALRSVDPRTRDLTEWLEYFVQGIAVEMVRVERRVEELGRMYRLESQVAQVALNPRQLKLLDYLRQSGASISNGEYQALFAVSKRTASNDLNELASHGLLAVEGAGPSTRYRLAGRET